VIPQIIIAEGVTLYTLNRNNFSMKNDYMDNLLATAFSVFPLVAHVLGAEVKIEVKKGFIAYAHYVEAVNPRATEEELAFTKGLGVQFSWAGFTEDAARGLAFELSDKIQDARIIYDLGRRYITVYRQSLRPGICEQVGEHIHAMYFPMLKIRVDFLRYFREGYLISPRTRSLEILLEFCIWGL
jgi:hypothetical protein